MPNYRPITTASDRDRSPLALRLLQDPVGCRRKGKIGCLLFVLLTVVPPILIPLVWYRSNVEYKNFHLMSHMQLTGVERILDHVDANLRRSPIYEPTHTFEALLGSGHFEYQLFAPFSRDAFGTTYPVFNMTFVTASDVAHDRVESSANSYNVRTLTGVLTHEFTHQLLNVTRAKLSNAESWKKEGYCDYLAHESSFDSAKGMQWLTGTPPEDPPKSFEYFVDRKLVEYELDTRHRTLQEFMNDPADRETVLKDYIEWVKKGRGS